MELRKIQAWIDSAFRPGKALLLTVDGDPVADWDDSATPQLAEVVGALAAHAKKKAELRCGDPKVGKHRWQRLNIDLGDLEDRVEDVPHMAEPSAVFAQMLVKYCLELQDRLLRTQDSLIKENARLSDSNNAGIESRQRLEEARQEMLDRSNERAQLLEETRAEAEVRREMFTSVKPALVGLVSKLSRGKGEAATGADFQAWFDTVRPETREMMLGMLSDNETNGLFAMLGLNGNMAGPGGGDSGPDAASDGSGDEAKNDEAKNDEAKNEEKEQV